MTCFSKTTSCQRSAWNKMFTVEKFQRPSDISISTWLKKIQLTSLSCYGLSIACFCACLCSGGCVSWCIGTDFSKSSTVCLLGCEKMVGRCFAGRVLESTPLRNFPALPQCLLFWNQDSLLQFWPRISGVFVLDYLQIITGWRNIVSCDVGKNYSCSAISWHNSHKICLICSRATYRK